MCRDPYLCDPGHNWGAEHDPDTDECGPSSRNNGKYVMWPYAVPGFEDNNKFFSPCSKRYIAPVLRSKSSFCFREFVVKVDPGNQTDSGSEGDFKGLCGNGIVEKGEECDVGFTEEGEADSCCTNKCRLKPGAMCSDFNHACCQGCQVANSTVLCEAKNSLACKDESFCNGIDLDCPAPGKLSDDTDCLDMGKCYNGSCLNFCALLGVERGKTMTPCLCVQNATAMCRRCCAEVGADRRKGECLPTKVVLRPGRTCHMGSCNDNGVCVKDEQQLALRIFSFIKSLTVSKLVEVMRTNIVGTIIILSLLIWIPASWVVSCVDKRKIVQEEDYIQRWVSRENSILGRSREDLSNFRIKNSRFKRLPPAMAAGGGGGGAGGHGNSSHQRRPPIPAAWMVDPVTMDTIREEPDVRRQLERQEELGWWEGVQPFEQPLEQPPGRTTPDNTRHYSDDVFDGVVLSGEDARMDSMDSADSIDLSATPGSVSEEEGRTVANV
ncbi:disintegrin and metalloproteinase domain-containing protein 17-like [Babylonia areolata]|uniref:disintegrin and metalloproteinase domain-containing protein 17-like n=1 Tax=Babylonia areolata TaxID=304850 RepID=UPI003FD0AD3A